MEYCEKCGAEIILRPRTIRDRSRLGLPKLCKKCIRREASLRNWSKVTGEDREAVMKRVHDGRDKYHAVAAASPEEKEKFKDAVKRGLSKLTEEEKEEWHKKSGESNKKYWQNITPEEYEWQCQRRKEGWAAMDPEKRKDWYDRLVARVNDEEYREKMSKSFKQYLIDHPEARERMSQRSMLVYANLSEEEKKKRAERVKEFWKSLSAEEYYAFQLKVAKGIEKSQAKKYKKNKLENDFEQILISKGIKYIHQYGTFEFYDPDTEFFKEYSKYSKFLGFRKNWDFYLPDYDIYIDIDGPFHTYAASYKDSNNELIRYLADKEVANYSFIQEYYDTRRILINKRIVILGYNVEKYNNTNASLELIQSEIDNLFLIIQILSSQATKNDEGCK